ncbi:MAG: hypothetical protein IKQ45_01025 [Clostridia bacterium]|nr:hypothetical protein [Clostridia bacterium]
MDPFTGNLVMIICFIVGSGLIMMEAFMPGFGAAGVFGILLEIVAIIVTGSVHGTVWGLVAAFGVLIFISLAVLISYRSAMHGRLSRSALVLKETEEASASSRAALDSWKGKTGTAVTALRPAGFVEIEGTRLNAAASGAFLEKGTSIVVTGVDGNTLVIRKA